MAANCTSTSFNMQNTHTKKRMSFLTESHQSTVLMISKRLIARMYHDCTRAFCTGITDNETLLALKYWPKIPCNSKIDSRCNLLKVDFRMLTSSCFFSRFENKVTLFRLSVVFLESKSIEFECSNRCFFLNRLLEPMVNRLIWAITELFVESHLLINKP